MKSHEATKANPLTVGRFTFDGEQIAGPEAYMRDSGFAYVDRFNRGELNHTIRFGYEQNGGDIILALLVGLQTDYAAWRGYQSLFGGGTFVVDENGPRKVGGSDQFLGAGVLG